MNKEHTTDGKKCWCNPKVIKVEPNREMQPSCRATPYTKKELKMRERKCWTPKCKRRAFLRDSTGYKHCLPCWYRSMKYGSGESKNWFFIKTTKIEL